VSGTRGSGTVFLSHCTLACLYCQNFPWSQHREGSLQSAEALADILADLAAQGCHNWNLVSPTPWLPQLRAASRIAKERGFQRPFVYNTSGFERIEVAETYRELMDVVLTDLRYADPRTAVEASAARDYVDAARGFAAWAWRHVGPLELDDDGIARRGMICRLLVLPGHADEAVANLEWLAASLGTEVHVSLMAQYTPVHRAASLPGWNRRVSREEYALVTDRLEALGFENGWVQALEEEDSGALLGCAMPAGGGSVPPLHPPPHTPLS
jgi:putative pyruvate formate lyase activating enzyme